MRVDLYIYKVQREFAEEIEDRYIARLHQFGTPDSKWTAAGSLVELEHCLMPLIGFDWYQIEMSLETKGGYLTSLQMDEFKYHQLFQTKTRK